MIPYIALWDCETRGQILNSFEVEAVLDDGTTIKLKNWVTIKDRSYNNIHTITVPTIGEQIKYLPKVKYLILTREETIISRDCVIKEICAEKK
jgi:hypothetical protein